MKRNKILILFLALFMLVSSLSSTKAAPEEQVLATRTISLETRYANQMVNDVFKDNILLTLRYLHGDIQKGQEINWEKIREPFHFEMVLKPERSFAYHEDVFPQYEGKIDMTTNAHFNSSEGFKSDGFLVGDGVCHLAALMYWVAKDAKLSAEAPTNHDFAVIPEVPREYGVSIYSMPGQKAANAVQNLYITNNQGKPVTMIFDYDGTNLQISIAQSKDGR